jgi:hypothetical protein
LAFLAFRRCGLNCLRILRRHLARIIHGPRVERPVSSSAPHA